MTGDPVTPTPSLQRRVMLLVVALLAVLLLVLGATVDFSLGMQARRNLHDRLLAATSRADALVAAHTAPDQMAAQLNGGSVRALVVMADGATYGDSGISPDTKAGSMVPPPGFPHPHGHPPGPMPIPPSGPPPGPPMLPPPPPPGIPPDGTATVVVHPLPDGARLILVADTTQTTAGNPPVA